MANKRTPKAKQASQPDTSSIPASMLGQYPIPENFSLYDELGRTGLTQYAGYVREEMLPELSGRQWRRVAKQMLWNDAIIAAMFLTVETLCRQVKFDVIPGTDDSEGRELKDFIHSALFEDMNQPFTETLSEALSMLPWGYHYAETVFKKRQGFQENSDIPSSKFNDNRVGWHKWAPRAQETLLHWAFKGNGDVSAFVQLSPPDWKIIPIPIEKAILFRTSTTKGNPEGQSLLRRSYVPYYFGSRIQNLEAVGIERDATGIPYMTCPAEYMSPTASDAKKAIYAQCQNIVTNVRLNEQAGAVIPSDVYPDSKARMFEFGLVQAAGQKMYDTDKILERWDRRKLMTLLADFLMLGHQRVGSFALAAAKTELFADACGGYLDAICEVINRHPIPKLARLNGFSSELKAPRLIHGDIETIDLGEIGNFILNLARANVNIEPITKQLIERAGFELPHNTSLMNDSSVALPVGASPALPSIPQNGTGVIMREKSTNSRNGRKSGVKIKARKSI